MAKLALDVPAKQKNRFKKYDTEHGNDALGFLIDRAKEADQLEWKFRMQKPEKRNWKKSLRN